MDLEINNSGKHSGTLNNSEEVSVNIQHHAKQQIHHSQETKEESSKTATIEKKEPKEEQQQEKQHSEHLPQQATLDPNTAPTAVFTSSLSSASSNDGSVNGDVFEKHSSATTRSLKSGSISSDDKPVEMKFIPTSVSSLLTSGSKSTEQIELESIALNQPASVFSELLYLKSSQKNNVNLDWKEIARWVKYEESVEENGTRWSKPFVSTVSLAAFDGLKRSLTEGIFILDSPAISWEDAVDEFVSMLRIKHNPDASLIERIVEDLHRDKRHQFQNKRSILSSFNDIRPNANKELSSTNVKVEDICGRSPKLSNRLLPALKINSLLNDSTDDVANVTQNNHERTITRSQSNGVLETIGETNAGSDAQIRQQALTEANNAETPATVGVSDQSGQIISNKNGQLTKNAFSATHLPKLQLPKSDSAGSFKPNKAFRKKIPVNSVGNSILTAEVDYLQSPVSGFIRLLNATDLGDLSEVSVPTKFIFIHLSPKKSEPIKGKYKKNDANGNVGNFENHTESKDKNHLNCSDAISIGRAFGTIMADTVFCDVALKGRSLESFLGGIDVFLQQAGVLPPNLWDVSTRLEPPEKSPPSAQQQSRRMTSLALLTSDSNFIIRNNDDDDKWSEHKDNHSDKGKPPSEKEHDFEVSVDLDSDEEEEIERQKMGLVRSGRLFGGLVNDIKRRLPHYKSDFTDGFAVQSVASIIFLYFACLTPIITFGGLLADATGGNIATMESLVCGALCGIVYGFFSGQPLTILGSTGPVLVFETIVYDFTTNNGFNYLSFRLWIGLWTALILLFFVAFDASYLVCYITRFTEENFASLISVIFIVKAIEKLFEIQKAYPVAPAEDLSDCECQLPNSTLTASLKHNRTIFEACFQANGGITGPGCGSLLFPASMPMIETEYKADIYFFSVILFVFTFIISIKLKQFRHSTYLGAKARELISDFAVPIAISSMTLMDAYWNIQTPKLQVPDTFKPTSSSRGWLITPFAPENPAWLIPFAILPALLATILIFMDQQITAVIVNRKENRLKKGCGYHLDLFVLSILIIICSFFGLPWFVAATVLSITHVNSLTMFSESAAPGDKPKFLGVREQRLTHIMIFVLCGLSIFFTSILQRIPMPVLYGVFLYMGISSLHGSQFLNRILLFFMPAKYQPDYIFLRRVPIYRIHLFTLIQLICFIFLWTVKSYKPISITFPLMLLVILTVRKLLDYCFTREELKILDDTMPESKRKKKERLRKKALKEENKANDVILFKAQLLNSDPKNA